MTEKLILKGNYSSEDIMQFVNDPRIFIKSNEQFVGDELHLLKTEEIVHIEITEDDKGNTHISIKKKE